MRCRVGEGERRRVTQALPSAKPTGAGALGGGVAGGAAAGAVIGSGLMIIPPLGVMALLTGVVVAAAARRRKRARPRFGIPT